jgi:hypothetical protein
MHNLVRPLLAIIMLFSTASVFANDLISVLTSQLGVTSEQASGGAGTLFQMAKTNLSESEFSQIAAVVPGIDEMMSAAESASKASETISSVTSMLSDNSSTGNLASLASTFSELGMGSDMIGQFMPIILDYLQSTGGETVMSLMKGALSL